MIRFSALLAGLVLSTAAGHADAPRDQLSLGVARELSVYRPDVDVSTLTRDQVASLHMVLFSSGSGSQKQAMIRSVLGGENSLRGLLFGQ